MKQTIKTSRAAGQLEKMFRALNAHFYAGALPEPIITLKKTPGAYGHITCGKTWQAGTERRYEINISTATLDRPIEETAATLLHEMAHLYNLENGIKDTSGSNTPTTTKRSSRQRKPRSYYRALRPLWLDHYQPVPGTAGLHRAARLAGHPNDRGPDMGRHDRHRHRQPYTRRGKWRCRQTTPKPTHIRKYICPCCKNSVRASKAVNLICGDCMGKMELAD